MSVSTPLLAEIVLPCPGPVPPVPLGLRGVEVLLGFLSTALLLPYMLLDATYRILLTCGDLALMSSASASAASAAFSFSCAARPAACRVASTSDALRAACHFLSVAFELRALQLAMWFSLQLHALQLAMWFALQLHTPRSLPCGFRFRRTPRRLPLLSLSSPQLRAWQCSLHLHAPQLAMWLHFSFSCSPRSLSYHA